MLNETSVTVDWLSYTAFWGSQGLPRHMQHASRQRLADRVAAGVHVWLEAKPKHGYTSALSSDDIKGLSVYQNVQRPDMGIHVVWTGRALAETELFTLMREMQALQASVTRIDIAVDVPEHWDIEALYKRGVEKDWVCKVKGKPVMVRSTGDTLYVGSRTSEKFLRVYDKQAEQGADFPWTRVELECKGETARGIAGYIALNGLDRIPDLIRGFCDFPNDTAWMKAMTTPTPPLSIPKAERHSDTDTWLLQGVMPTLVKRVMESADFAKKFEERWAVLAAAYGGAGEVDIFDGKGDFEL